MSRQTIVGVCAANLFNALSVTAATSPAKAEGLVVSAFRENPAERGSGLLRPGRR